MSTRTLSDRELLLDTARRVAELAEQVADLHTRLERLASSVGSGAALGSRRAELETEHTPDTTARLRDYLEGPSYDA